MANGQPDDDVRLHSDGVVGTLGVPKTEFSSETSLLHAAMPSSSCARQRGERSKGRGERASTHISMRRSRANKDDSVTLQPSPQSRHVTSQPPLSHVTSQPPLSHVTALPLSRVTAPPFHTSLRLSRYSPPLSHVTSQPPLSHVTALPLSHVMSQPSLLLTSCHNPPPQSRHNRPLSHVTSLPPQSRHSPPLSHVTAPPSVT